MKPTKAQEAFLEKCFGCCRFVYNYALNKRIEAYKNEKKSLSFFDQCEMIRELKKQEEYAWLGEVSSTSLDYSLLNLNNAYNQFFKTKQGFPNFKSKKRSKDSINLLLIKQDMILNNSKYAFPNSDG